MQKKLREEIIGLIMSKDLREYLLSGDADISDEDLLKTIGAAPISLTRKKRLLSRCMKDNETKDEIRQKAEKESSEISTALSRLWHMKPNDVLLMVQCRTENIGGLNLYTASDVLRDGAKLFRDFKAAKNYMDMRIYYYESEQLDYFDMIYDKERKDHPELDWKFLEKEWLKPPYWFWNIFLTNIDDYNKDKAATPDHLFICSPEGELQYLSSPECDSILHGGHTGDYLPPTPYRPGDILQINCLPYAPESTYCLVIDKMKSGEVFCLYPTVSGNVGIGEINNGYYYENHNYCCQYLPPLFCAEKYTGELPENCAFMKKLSKQLLNHPELGCEIGERTYHFYPFTTDGTYDIFGKFYRYERWRFNKNDWQVPPEKIIKWADER